MMRALKYAVGAFFAILLLISCNDNKQVDWTEYYETNRKDPYGLFIFNVELEKIKPEFSEIIREKRGVSSYYQKESEEILYGSLGPNTYLYIDDEDKMNVNSRQKLFDLANSGSHVFIASHDLTEFTNFECLEYHNDTYPDVKLDTIIFHGIKKSNLASSNRITSLQYFTILDSAWVQPLGYYQEGDASVKKCNFAALRYGNGMIFLHSNPEVFTNYFLLKNKNASYTEFVMSHLKNSTITWFVNYKYEFEEDYGVLSYIMNQPALRTAWYLLWILLIFVIITYAKRMQRIIPVITPKKNYSVDYAKRLAQFHLLEKNYQGLIDKQILIILDKLRNEHRIDISQIDDSFAEKMHLITNCDKLAAEDFVRYVNKHRARSVAFYFDFEELRKIVNKLNL